MSKLLKELYNEKYITLLVDNITIYYPSFNKQSFINTIFCSSWDKKELKERMRHISTTLNQFFPFDYKTSIDILKKTFSKINYDFNLENIIFQDFVEVYGLDYFDLSMDALEHFTINSTSEFAIRQFIIKYPNKTMKQMILWANNENEHIRRLASEGCRPRLPWAISLSMFKKDPTKVLDILNILKNDKSKYVQKSIANNINDISKDNPKVVLELSKKWINKSSEINWILNHGCRTLLKNGNKDIFKLFGFKDITHIEISNIVFNMVVYINENLEFSFELNSKTNLGKIRVEYEIEFLRQNYNYNKKVFKIYEGVVNNKSKEFSKKHSFKPITTRKYYKGIQRFTIIINGIRTISNEFVLN
ncbi:MAG: DNA alkylation repair protein [Campylobacterota bacterium]|nr:DNA alkylation repair protein [Campylobacterota bacterium]